MNVTLKEVVLALDRMIVIYADQDGMGIVVITKLHVVTEQFWEELFAIPLEEGFVNIKTPVTNAITLGLVIVVTFMIVNHHKNVLKDVVLMEHVYQLEVVSAIVDGKGLVATNLNVAKGKVVKMEESVLLESLHKVGSANVFQVGLGNVVRHLQTNFVAMVKDVVNTVDVCVNSKKIVIVYAKKTGLGNVVLIMITLVTVSLLKATRFVVVMGNVLIEMNVSATKVTLENVVAKSLRIGLVVASLHTTLVYVEDMENASHRTIVNVMNFGGDVGVETLYVVVMV